MELQSHFKLLSVSHTSLKACIGQHVVVIGGVKFESRLQTVAWVEKHLPSAAYFVFNDVITVLDSLVSYRLSNKEFIEGEYRASRGQFDNAVVARVTASFGRELPQIFGRVETSPSGSLPSSIHPLPSIKVYELFNSPGTHSGIKHQITDNISHILSSINNDISSRLAGLPVALMLANTFLVNAKSSIESLLTWMDSFYHELQASDSSSKDAWLLVCSCVRFYFKELRKVRTPAQAALNMASPVKRAVSYI